jgi:hypothetical protein
MNEPTAEIWRPVAGWEGAYEVSNCGGVRSCPRIIQMRDGRSRPARGSVLVPWRSVKGYLKVALSRPGNSRGMFVHRLVAMAFLPNPLGLPQVNHIDCDRANSHVSNLEWVTASQNNKHAFAVGRLRPPTDRRGGDINGARLTEAMVIQARAMRRDGVSCYQIARTLGVHRSTIDDVVSGHTWAHVPDVALYSPADTRTPSTQEEA